MLCDPYTFHDCEEQSFKDSYIDRLNDLQMPISYLLGRGGEEYDEVSDRNSGDYITLEYIKERDPVLLTTSTESFDFVWPS